MPVITSRRHPLVNTFRVVARGDAERALLDGWHLIHEAVAARIAVELVAVTGEPDARDRALLDRLREHADVLPVSTSVMDAISPVRSPAGVAAIVRRTTPQLRDVLSPAPALVLAAIDMQDPGNVGAMIRAAEAGGATGVVLAGASADAWGWKALRASMGSTFRLPVVRVDDASEACASLQGAGVRLLATMPRDGALMHAADLRRPTALLMGSEGAGLPAAVLSRADGHIMIPMRAPVESLNVAVAAALLVYEATRQRA